MRDEPTAEELANYRVDRTNWEPGPWDGEPDRTQWQHAGYACLMVRHPRHGNWCGYVGVDETNPAFSKSWKNKDEFPDLESDVNYSDFCDGVICHVPAPGMPERVWWIGFDCGHAWDVHPGMHSHLPAAIRERYREEDRSMMKGTVLCPTYKTVAYVRKRVNALAEIRKANAG
jgi:hypothetical protein